MTTTSATRWVVLTRVGADGFENVWTDTDAADVATPTTFASEADAKAALDEFLRDARSDGLTLDAADYAIGIAA